MRLITATIMHLAQILLDLIHVLVTRALMEKLVSTAVISTNVLQIHARSWLLVPTQSVATSVIVMKDTWVTENLASTSTSARQELILVIKMLNVLTKMAVTAASALLALMEMAACAPISMNALEEHTLVPRTRLVPTTMLLINAPVNQVLAATDKLVSISTSVQQELTNVTNMLIARTLKEVILVAAELDPKEMVLSVKILTSASLLQAAIKMQFVLIAYFPMLVLVIVDSAEMVKHVPTLMSALLDRMTAWKTVLA